jgi:hypothetical protein
VVCAVRYEPVSLLFGQYQGDFREKQRADYEKSKTCPQTLGFSLSRRIREQGETGSIDRRQQGDEFVFSLEKPEILLLAGCPLGSVRIRTAPPKWVLACFDPSWPNLKVAVAYFGK